MNFILKNIEKIILSVFAISFIILVMAAKWGVLKKVEALDLPDVPKEFNMPQADCVQLRNYIELLDKSKAPKEISEYAGLTGRNLFYEYHESEDAAKPFIVKEIKTVPLNFIYKGLIELPSNKVIAQINFENKTYFLKPEEFFAEYQVKEITKERCMVLDAKGKELELPYQKEVSGEEYEALLYDNKTKNSLNVKKDFKIREYQVLDIKADYVVLLQENGGKIILKKGE